MVELGGWTEPAFEPVVGAFVENFEKRRDVGAACSVYVDGQPVVDIWGGMADPAGRDGRGRRTRSRSCSRPRRARPRSAHTCSCSAVRSTSMPPSRAYWPEFAAARQGTDHRPAGARATAPGSPHVDGDLTLDEVLAWDPVVDAHCRARRRTGSRARRTATTCARSAGSSARSSAASTGRSLGRFFADEIAAPLGLDFWIGLPESEEPRVATIVPPEPPDDPEARALVEQLTGPDTFLGKRHGRAIRVSSPTTTCGTRARCTRPSCRRRTASPTHARWRACTRPRPATSTACASSIRTRSRPRAGCSPTGPTR